MFMEDKSYCEFHFDSRCNDNATDSQLQITILSESTLLPSGNFTDWYNTVTSIQDKPVL